jgi:1,4-dihydroxy-2-naphthoate octaprenyltransferase
MNKIQVWVSSLRLRTLPLSISGILIGSSFAYYNGFFNYNIFILAILTTIFLQILSNLANDYGDGVKGTDNKNRIGPERALQSGKISAKEMKLAIIINIILLIVLISFLVFISFESTDSNNLILFLFLGFISVVAAIKYTIGNNAYGYFALGDIFVLFFFGFLSIIGSYYLYSKEFKIELILISISVGLLSVGVLNLNNMRDIISDKKSQKITIAGKLGFNYSKIYQLCLIVISIISSFFFILSIKSNIYIFLVFISYLPLIYHIKNIINICEPIEYNRELKFLALSTLFFSIIHCLIIIN